MAPDRERVAVEQIKGARARSRRTFEPDWSLFGETPDAKAPGEPIFRGLPAKRRERVQGDLVSLWQEMLSLNAALAEVADEFGGEDSPQADNAG